MENYLQEYYQQDRSDEFHNGLHDNPFAAMFNAVTMNGYQPNDQNGPHYPAGSGYYGQGPIVHEGFIPAAQNAHFGHDMDTNSQDHSGISTPWAADADDEIMFDYEGEEADGEDDVMMNDELVLHSDLPDLPDYALDPDYSMSDGDMELDHGSEADLDSGSDYDQEPVRKRGRGRGRGSTRGRGRGRGRGRPRGSRRRADTDSRGAPRRGRRGPREAKDPGPVFKKILSEATQAWIRQDLETAQKAAGEAIKINPEVFAAYNLLSEILYAKGQLEESVNVLSMGAVLQRDAALWHKIATRVLELDIDERARLEWAHRCYSQVIRLDNGDWEARCQRLDFQLRFDHKGQAKLELEMMLKIEGHQFDLDRIQQLAELCAVTREPARAVEPFEKAIRHHLTAPGDDYSQLDWQSLNSYLELMSTLKRYEDSIPLLKSTARYIVGRQDESYWDGLEDDREWDIDDEPRRVEVDRFVPGRYPQDAYGVGLPLEIRVKLGLFRLGLGNHNEAQAHFQHLEPEDASDTATVLDFDDLFRDVADALTIAGCHAEALRYYKALKRIPEVPQTALRISIAACYFAMKKTDEAEQNIDEALEIAGQNLSSRLQVARFFQEWGMMERCEDIARDVIQRGGADLVRKAKIKVQLPQTAKSAQARLPPARKLQPLMPKPASRELKVQPKPTTLQSQEPKKISSKSRKAKEPEGPRRRLRGLLDSQAEKLEEAQERDKLIRELFSELNSLQAGVDDGDPEAIEAYMDAASEMVDEFRRMEAFYPRRDKNVKFGGYFGRSGRMKESSLAYIATVSNRANAAEVSPDQQPDPETIPEDFHDISFNAWLDIFCQHALLLAKKGINGRCWSVLEGAALANVFHHDPEREYRIHVTWMACALLLRDEEHLCNACRYLIKRHPYADDAYRLFGTINRVYTGHRTWYNAGPSQKFILRLIKAMDFALLDDASRKMYKFGDQERSGYTRGGQNDGNPEGISEVNVALLAMYGHVLASGGTYLNALNYYFRAYSITPEDPILNFSIAIAYIQHAMKRQSENRQYQIQQGLAFLYRYYKLRIEKNIASLSQEAEFNVARVWHTLGLVHLALPSYEKVLALSEDVRQENATKSRGSEVDDFAADAAFSVQTILSLADELRGARGITEKWLVL
ncbi:hypothetical protein IWZ03DRAFT_99387 [Phyllosticta citriasiana]|uniref:TPR-like protein n=1 Tax=Phyllosticta citriasiana TaxID=595635 RepID=A0ABR1KW60_9PEZI